MEHATPSAVAPDGLLADLRAKYIPDAIVLLRDGAITWASPNAPEVLGWAPGELVGSSLDSLMHDDDRQAVRAACGSADAGERAGLVVRAARAGAGPATLELLVQPCRPADDLGTVVATLRPIDKTVAFRESATAGQTAPRALADRAGDIFFVLDGRGAVLEVSPTMQHTLGWTAEEFAAFRPNDYVHPDDLAALGEYRTDVQAGTATGSLEMRVRARGGAYRSVQATAVMVRDGGAAHPERTRVLVSWRDIDALVRERGFAERETTRLRALMDTALDPWLVLTPLRDVHGSIVDFVVGDANQGAADYLRWPRERLVGTHLLQEFPELGELGLMEAYVDCIESGEPISIYDVAYPHEMLGNGRLYELSGRRVDGSLMLTWRDTTSASTARNELAANESLFRRLAQSAGDAALAVTRGHVDWASPGAVAMGLALDEDFEAVMSGLVAPDSVSQVRTCCVLMEGSHDYTGRWHRPDAPPLIVRARSMPGPVPQTAITMVAETWTLKDPREEPGGA